MNKLSLSTTGILVAALLVSVSVGAATDDAKIEVIPKGMDYQGFIDLNPQTVAPVTFWVFNENEDFKGGDYVDYNEIATTAVPLTTKLCKKHPQSELSKIKNEIKEELSKQDLTVIKAQPKYWVLLFVTLSLICFAILEKTL